MRGARRWALARRGHAGVRRACVCTGRANGCAGCVARSGLVGGRELGAGARAAGERQRRWGAQDERACRRAGRAGSGRAGARAARLGRRAALRTERAEHDRLGSTGAQPVRTGWASWASWVLVHPAWFSAWFFDSVFFLSH